MAALQSLLAIYAALDQSVVNANDPAWTARVEKLLPGTTAEGRRGWSRDVEQWLRQLAPDPSKVVVLKLDAALAELRGTPDQRTAEPTDSGATDSVVNVGDADNDRGDADAETTQELSPTALASLLYGWKVLRQLSAEATDLEPFRSQFTLGPERETDAMFERYYLQAATAGPPRTRIPGIEDLERQRRAAGLRDLLDSTTFDSGAQWAVTMREAHEAGFVEPEFAGLPLPIAGVTRGLVSERGGSTAAAAVTEIDDIYCAVLETDSWRTDPQLTVQAVKDVANPRNWDKLLNSFFCAMEPDADDARGASRILEHVSLDKDVFRMKTALRYWAQDFGSADKAGVRGGIINYELAEGADRARLGDSGLVLVDSGYIHISRTLPDGSDGVRVRTSKMVAVQGGSVTATAMYILSIGWAAISDSMFFRSDPANRVAFAGDDGQQLQSWQVNKQPNPVPPDDPVRPEDPTKKPGNGTNVQAPQQDQQIPDFSGAYLKQAAKMWASYVTDTTQATGKLVEKWYQNKLTPNDMITYTAEIAGRLASQPWQYLANVTEEVKGQQPGNGDT